MNYPEGYHWPLPPKFAISVPDDEVWASVVDVLSEGQELVTFGYERGKGEWQLPADAQQGEVLIRFQSAEESAGRACLTLVWDTDNTPLLWAYPGYDASAQNAGRIPKCAQLLINKESWYQTTVAAQAWRHYLLFHEFAHLLGLGHQQTGLYVPSVHFYDNAEPLRALGYPVPGGLRAMSRCAE